MIKYLIIPVESAGAAKTCPGFNIRLCERIVCLNESLAKKRYMVCLFSNIFADFCIFVFEYAFTKRLCPSA